MPPLPHKSKKMAYKKIDREFCLTDDSVNVYGYRLLTSGLRLDRFTPPIGFLMHDRERGVAVRWEDFRTEEGRVYAKPVVNTSQFPQLAQQIEDGFYSAASVGHIVVLKYTDDDSSKLEGQTGITVLEWFPRECSIVDIPGNYNAIAKLYDERDNLLHDLIDNNNHNTMEKATIEVASLGLPNLTETSTASEAVAAIRELADRASRAESAEKELAELKSAINAEKVQALLDGAVSDRKLTRLMADKLKTAYGDDPGGLKALLDTMPVMTGIHDNLSDELPEKYRGKTFRELYISGDLADIQENYPEYYKQLKNEQ